MNLALQYIIVFYLLISYTALKIFDFKPYDGSIYSYEF